MRIRISMKDLLKGSDDGLYLRGLEVLSEFVPQFSSRVDGEDSGHWDTYSPVGISILKYGEIIDLELEIFKCLTFGLFP